MSNVGFYLNSGKDLFVEALNGQIYMDKTAMVAEVNALLNTPGKISPCFLGTSFRQIHGGGNACRILWG